MPGVDPNFPMMTEESADPQRIPRESIVEELARELCRRREAYPARVAAGRLARETAEWRIDILEAIHADLRADLGRDTPEFWRNLEAWRPRRHAADKLLARFRWADLVEELQREIVLRRRFYPAMIENGDLRRATAIAQLERIEAAHFLYWRLGRRWWPDELDAKRYRGDLLTEQDHTLFREASAARSARFEPVDTHPRGAYADGAQASAWAS